MKTDTITGVIHSIHDYRNLDLMTGNTIRPCQAFGPDVTFAGLAVGAKVTFSGHVPGTLELAKPFPADAVPFSVRAIVVG